MRRGETEYLIPEKVARERKCLTQIWGPCVTRRYFFLFLDSFSHMKHVSCVQLKLKIFLIKFVTNVSFYFSCFVEQMVDFFFHYLLQHFGIFEYSSRLLSPYISPVIISSAWDGCPDWYKCQFSDCFLLFHYLQLKFIVFQ